MRNIFSLKSNKKMTFSAKDKSVNLFPSPPYATNNNNNNKNHRCQREHRLEEANQLQGPVNS